MYANPDTQKEIQQVVSILLNKYHNRDPFAIARNMGVEYSFLNFENNLAAFSECKNDKDHGRIYINQKYGSYARKILCGHELGHLLLHREYGETFFDAEIEPEKEYEANYFVAMLLPYIITNDSILNFPMEAFNKYIAERVNYARQLEGIKLL